MTKPPTSDAAGAVFDALRTRAEGVEMNSEVLRLLDEIEDEVHGWDQWPKAKGDQLRALLSAQEPTAEHFRRALRECSNETYALGDPIEWVDERARELAKQEAK